ncbi:MAG: PTPA-CTERM sorting domain-containing protein [Planctomycetes bacterium]|nr:PTPA-CTERM sorting domain-containing protein [Planctomycetota bacterium]
MQSGQSLTATVTAVLCLAIASMFTTPVDAAVITWGAVDGTDAISDISTSGILVTAVNAGGASNQTVNGVTFVTSNTAPLGMAASGMLIGTVAGFSAGDPIFNMLNSVSFGGGTGTTSINLAVTNGLMYQIQLFYADRRNGNESRVMRYGDGNGNNVDVLGGTNAGNVMGRNVLGTFTAIGSTQTITMAPQGFGNSHINAYQLRLIPTPTALLAGLTLMGLLAMRKRD